MTENVSGTNKEVKEELAIYDEVNSLYADTAQSLTEISAKIAKLKNFHELQLKSGSLVNGNRDRVKTIKNLEEILQKIDDSNKKIHSILLTNIIGNVPVNSETTTSTLRPAPFYTTMDSSETNSDNSEKE